jgi:hypothetical protein
MKNCELGVGYEKISQSGEVTNDVVDVNAIQVTHLFCREQGLAGKSSFIYILILFQHFKSDYPGSPSG